MVYLFLDEKNRIKEVCTELLKGKSNLCL
uniref:Uncharacterized protein n=1 Tax=Arundo donax TaxID=35708 RepID=A0A0A9F6R7_ARUDO